MGWDIEDVERELRMAEARIAELEAQLKSSGYVPGAERYVRRIKRLEAALNRAGDRLAQVQPGVTEPWAFDIVPTAEQEIADALAGDER